MNIIPIRPRELVAAALGCFLLVGSSASAQAAPSSIHVDIDKRRVAVAEPFVLTVTVEAPQGAVVKFPPPAERLGAFEVLAVRDHFDIPTESGRQWLRRYELETIQTGEHEIPAFEVAYTNRPQGAARKGVLTSPPSRVSVVSSLAADETPENFRDIKNAILLDVSPRWLNAGRAAGIGTVAILFAAAAMVVWQLKRPLTPRKWAL
ncbi:MAG: BatD family protein, partial [Planctomycetota bacterium]